MMLYAITQDKIREFFSVVRDKALNCVFLSQSYSCIMKQLVSDNSNIIILLRQDETNLIHVFDDVPKGEFRVFSELII